MAICRSGTHMPDLRQRQILRIRGAKSSGQFVGAASFASLCGEMEENAVAGALEGADELAEKIRRELVKIQKELAQ